MKIRIKAIPRYGQGGAPSTGDQQNLGLFTNQTVRIDPNDYNRLAGAEDVRTTYPQVPAEKANVEVEKGEIIVSPDLSAIYKAGGKKHSAGGTKIKAQEGSYVVSDFIKTDPGILEALGFDPKKDGKQTWASLLQSKVDPTYFNGLAGVLSDKQKGKTVDPFTHNTARVKMPALQEIISKVALGNELTKAAMGKNYAIPQVAGPAVQSLQSPEPQPGDQPLTTARQGGYLAFAQQGKQVDTDLFNPFWTTFLKEHPSAIVSPQVAENPHQRLSSPQHQVQKGMYGSIWDLGELRDRHDWYFKDHPDFDPKDPKQVRDFQQEYNKRASELFGQPYFYGSGDFRALDGKLGKYTYNAPDLSVQPATKTTAPPPTTPVSVKVPPVTPPQNPVVPTPSFDNTGRTAKLNPNAFDQIALVNAMSAPVHTYYPWAAKPQAAYINPQFDEHNYYPIQSAGRQRQDMLNQVSTPATARAVGSYQPDQISGILQETQRARGNNLQAATNAQSFNAQTFDNISGQNAQIDTNLYDKTVMSKEQHDIATRLKQQDVQYAAHNMVNNMTRMQYMMAMNPQFSVSGPFWDHVSFNGNGKSLDSPMTAGPSSPMMSREQFLAQYPGYAALSSDPQQAYKIDEAMRQERDRAEALMFRSSRNVSANMYNPYVASMLGIGMGYPPAGY